MRGRQIGEYFQRDRIRTLDQQELTLNELGSLNGMENLCSLDFPGMSEFDVKIVGWIYRWDIASQTGRAILSPFIAKMNFREHYSILQKAIHQDLQIKSCRNYLIRPVYDCVIKEDLRKVRFDLTADHYVHYFVIDPPVDRQVFRVCYVSGRTQTGDKVALTFKNGSPKFDVNTSVFDEMFRKAISLSRENLTPMPN
jgi:hypothetical protein